jgi:TonB family protein
MRDAGGPAEHGRWLIATTVAIVHVVGVAFLVGPPNHAQRDTQPPHEDPITTVFLPEQAARDVEPVPEVALATPRIDLKAITMIRFESADWGDISGIVAPCSAPTLSRFQPVSAAAFARRAGLRQGQAASVVLTIEVLPDGTVGMIEVARGFGDPAVDAAAVAFGRSLRWIPGTRDHHAEAMRINLPVTLVWTI